MATKEQMEEWFKAVDTDGSGSLAYSELSDFLVDNRGYTAAQVEAIFDTADTSGDGQVTMEEYVAAMSKTASNVHNESALRKVCKSFDKNGDGTIDKTELKAVFDELSRDLSMSDVERIMKMTDTDGDGVIDYNELCMKVFGQSCD
ncbi:uncharacterized protein [Watersipora subatra]|uniref:uncharacterized protein isoform X2 n=1 Tax=Watersipora subatra TaxID=2589382 RepID=UPI00355C3981